MQKFTENGLFFILDEDHSIPNISLGLNIDAGSTSDPEGKEGLSQLTMDMLLRGTSTKSRDQISESIEYLGANLSTAVNLSSSSIDGETLTRFLDEFMAIFGDIVRNPVFKQTELDKLKQETIDLLKLSLNNDSLLGRRHFLKLVYGDHPYGKQTDGTLKSLRGITLDDVRNCYARLLRKGLITVYAAGDIDKAKLTQLVATHFSGLPDGAAERPRFGAPKPLQKRRLVIVDKPDRTQVQIFIGHPTIAAKDSAYYPLKVANTAFGGFFNSRYQTEIRVKRGWSYGANSNMSLNREAGFFVLRTFTGEQNIGPAIKKSLEMLDELSKKGLTPDELEKAKNHLINEYPFLIDTADKRVDEQLRIRTFDLPADYLEGYQKRIAAVNGDSVARTTQRYLDANNIGIVVVCEAKRCRKTLEEAIDSLASVEVVPYDSL